MRRIKVEFVAENLTPDCHWSFKAETQIKIGFESCVSLHFFKLCATFSSYRFVSP